MKEMVLYYSPEPMPYVAKLKGVLVQMGVRIKNIRPEQVTQTIGYLAGMDGYEKETAIQSHSAEPDESASGQKSGQTVLPAEEMLVMKGFTSRRIDELLMNLRKAGVPKIRLKAVVTESNCPWTFCQLYEELLEENKAMSENNGK